MRRSFNVSPALRHALVQSYNLVLLLLGLSILGCATSPHVVLRGDPAPPTAHGAQLQGTLVDLHTQRFLPFDTLVAEVSRVQVVALGEEHSHPDIQAFELRLLQALAASRPQRLALAMEFLERDQQPAVDDYVAGTIDTATFHQRIKASPDFIQLYFPLMQYARQVGVPVIAMNTPRHLARRVAKEGLQETLRQLPATERAYVPASLSTVTSRYRTYFLEAVAASHPLQGEQAERFVEAAHLKDDTMAATLAAFLDRHPDFTVLAIAGRFHVDYGTALPSLLHQRYPHATIRRITTMAVATEHTIDLRRLAQEAIADYLWFAPPRPGTRTEQGRLGEKGPGLRQAEPATTRSTSSSVRPL
jgi:uncharacterized iron-regulated protein